MAKAATKASDLKRLYTGGKKLLVTKGIATRSKDATRGAPGLLLGTRSY